MTSKLPHAVRAEVKLVPDEHEIGDIAYWSPGPDIAVFYDHDGESIPDPGIVILGKIDHLRADALKKYDGAVDVAIEAID
ncbi:cyclophilin-like fold protein [Streptomyces afghaniensis]|uniref:cyclophilin-like fold protein n=1 Tax=Streptomyces afghaniensis TaxID=66865 RepID=UPI0033BEF088